MMGYCGLVALIFSMSWFPILWSASIKYVFGGHFILGLSSLSASFAMLA